jgi:hypothetical protein
MRRLIAQANLFQSDTLVRNNDTVLWRKGQVMTWCYGICVLAGLSVLVTLKAAPTFQLIPIKPNRPDQIITWTEIQTTMRHYANDYNLSVFPSCSCDNVAQTISAFAYVNLSKDDWCPQVVPSRSYEDLTTQCFDNTACWSDALFRYNASLSVQEHDQIVRLASASGQSYWDFLSSLLYRRVFPNTVNLVDALCNFYQSSLHGALQQLNSSTLFSPSLLQRKELAAALSSNIRQFHAFFVDRLQQQLGLLRLHNTVRR